MSKQHVQGTARPVLVDLLQAKLKIVFCETAAGNRSAERGLYYAGRGNRFWEVLQEVGLTDVQLTPEEFRRLPDHGIGLTDLAKQVHGMDHDLASDAFDVEGLVMRIRDASPKVVAFNGKKAASIFRRRPTVSIGYGLQKERIGTTTVHVLPSTSAAARGHWTPEPWRALAAQFR